MKKMLLVAAAIAALVPAYLSGQQGGGRGQAGPREVVVGQLAGKPVIQPVVRGVDYRDAINPNDPAMNGPVPRLPDGHPDLTGPWEGGGSDNDMGVEGGLKPGELDALLLPAARALKAERSKAIYGEPYIYCLPMSVPRINPYPWKFVMGYTSKGLQYVYQLHETGDAGAHRVIYMDGRPHPNPDTLIPSWWGHSIGRWDGDTLVIDTVGYNDKFWFDAPGTPHSEQLHTIERWTRISYGTLVNDFRIEDPGTFTRPVELRFVARIVKPNVELMEYICAENNQIGLAGGYLKPGSPGIAGGAPPIGK